MRKSTEAKAVPDQDFGILGFPVTTDSDDDVDSGDGEREDDDHPEHFLCLRH